LVELQAEGARGRESPYADEQIPRVFCRARRVDYAWSATVVFVSLLSCLFVSAIILPVPSLHLICRDPPPHPPTHARSRSQDYSLVNLLYTRIRKHRLLSQNSRECGAAGCRPGYGGPNGLDGAAAKQ